MQNSSSQAKDKINNSRIESGKVAHLTFNSMIQERDDRTEKNRVRLTEEEKRQQADLEKELKKKQIRLVQVKQWLANPMVVIENNMTSSSKRQYLLLRSEHNLYKESCDNLNELLIFFGHPLVTMAALAMSIILGFFWVYQTLGMDFVAGNQTLTICLFTGVLVALDLGAFYSISGGLGALANFMPSKTYFRLLEIIILVGFTIGSLTFVFNVFLRLAEVSV